MSPHGAPHDGAIQRLTKKLITALLGRAEVRIHSALVLGESQPEPDAAVVPPGDYDDAHPREAWLVVEVAESSLRKDRSIKGRLYAEHAISEYWIVNLVDKLIEVHTDPVRDAYTRVVSYRKGESIALQRFPDVRIAVDEILR